MVNSISPRSLWSLSHLDKNKLPESFPHLDLILCWKMSIWALVREVSNGLFIQDHHRHRTQHPRSNARHLRTARSLSLEIKQPLSHWKIREDPWNIEKTLHNILKTYNEKHETSNFESKCSFMTIYVFDVFDSFGPYKNTEHEGDRRNSHGFVGCNTPIIPEPPTKVTATQALSPGIVLSSSDRRRRKKKQMPQVCRRNTFRHSLWLAMVGPSPSSPHPLFPGKPWKRVPYSGLVYLWPLHHATWWITEGLLGIADSIGFDRT